MRIIVSLLLCAAAAPVLACGPDTDCMLGDRLYRIAMPAGYDGTVPVGAVVFAHGYRGSAEGIMQNGSLRKAVSDMGLALIAADAAGDDWVIPNSPHHMDTDGAEEFAYFDAVLDDAGQRFNIDAHRIMAAGFSAGGMMVWNLACSRPERFAGFLAVSGSFWLHPPETCRTPVASIVHIHGDADTTVPLGGRAIGPTRQCVIEEALEMYAGFGGFGPAQSSSEGDLGCEAQTNPQGALLEFCLFPGGHSFRTEFVPYAWSQFNKAGRL